MNEAQVKALVQVLKALVALVVRAPDVRQRVVNQVRQDITAFEKSCACCGDPTCDKEPKVEEPKVEEPKVTEEPEAKAKKVKK